MIEISTVKLGAENILNLLGHKLISWQLKGTKIFPIYYNKCPRLCCSEDFRLFRLNKFSNNEIWRLLFGSLIEKNYFNFAISTTQNNTDNINYIINNIEVDHSTKEAIFKLESNFYCSRMRNFR